jgi:hypothetical protein
MAILLAGSGPTVMQSATWSTTATYFDANYANTGAYCSETAGLAGTETPTHIADGSEYWVHFVSYYYHAASSQAAARNLVVARNASTDVSFVLLGQGRNSSYNYLSYCTLYSYNTIGESASVNIEIPNNSLHHFDFHVYQDGANAQVALYLAGSLAASAAVAGTSRGFKTLYLGAKNNVSSSFSTYSELIVSTTDTRGLRAKTLLPTSNGIYSEWEGDYTSVDEPAAPDGLAVVSSSPNQRISFGKEALAAGANVGQVFVNVLGSAAAGNDVVGGLRVAGADYYSDEMGLSSGMLPGNSSFLVNPATGLPFTAEELNASELILKSVEV